VPSDLTAVLAEKARLSIGDTYLVASQLPVEQGTALINAGKIAFSSAHVNLLLTAGIIIGILSIVVFFMLAKYRDENSL